MSQGTEGRGLREQDAAGRVQLHFAWLDEETGEIVMEPSRTKQEFADESDINNIIKNILRTGANDWLEKNDAWMKETGDVEVPNVNFRELMTTLAEANERFMGLPSAVRAGFGNDAAAFTDWVQSEGGNVELQELIDKAKPAAEKKGSVNEASKPAEPDGEPPETPPAAPETPSGGEDP